MNKILIVEASDSDRRLMSGLLVKSGYEPIAFESMEAAKEAVVKLPPGAVVVTAMKFAHGTAQELINWQKCEGYKFPVIAIVDNMNAVDLLSVMRDGGAVDVVQRPAIDKQLVETVGRYAKPESVVIQLDNALIPRRSAKFKEIEQSIERIAQTNVNCIIFGESGMGKEQIARQIYLQSSRTQKPITVIEAGGAELVGLHDPKSDRNEMYNRIKSYSQNAAGGTIILKNIQLLNFEKQSVFLHILSEEHPDVRMICTANGTLMKMLAEEDFRDNLFYMLRQSGINVPPLREMTEDIPDIADYLLAIYAHKTSQVRKRLDASAIKALKLYPWPGNIRELKDTILMAAFHADGDIISADDLVFSDIQPETAEDLTHRNPKAEKDRIIRAYIRAGTWRGAAKLLNVSEKTLIQLRKKHHINPHGEIES
ncbi:sigma 54-interacting transcriptional regulator [Muribaculum gordoncarteri]|jgi:DNA-binding NtrC family response regulator|uniref:Sigma-54-dependent Fis family transcriptional regulator n=1 Tax=Muribaculum gordoncarteri TaxID=2530390 RepID=A0A4P7VRD3_9BACT|nr:sigma 54-interacting transcriptional regulator [Muribaculum gordoncarteri]QCD36901.1 sigma-54-dependent Fis family transcriptional regulator [Muribaculum gordoncarteri]